jgi:putative transposase
MARIARVVIPKVPHHVTQRGNRRQTVFFNADDYAEYISLISEWCGKYHVDILGYCLMPNHVHLIAVPKHAEDLALSIGEAHRRYSRRINERNDWRGHLWQERFASYPMDDTHLLLAARYIELNPVRAGLVELPGDYSWSSAAAHLAGVDDVLVKVKPLLSRVDSWEEFLQETVSDQDQQLMWRHENSGKPLGQERFIQRVEKLTGREFAPKKTGPKPKSPV